MPAENQHRLLLEQNPLGSTLDHQSLLQLTLMVGHSEETEVLLSVLYFTYFQLLERRLYKFGLIFISV